MPVTRALTGHGDLHPFEITDEDPAAETVRAAGEASRRASRPMREDSGRFCSETERGNIRDDLAWRARPSANEAGNGWRGHNHSSS